MIADLQPYLFASLGFLFGLLGPIVVDRNRRKLDTDETYSAVLIELDELRYRIANGAFGISLDHGKATREHVVQFYTVASDFEKRHAREGISGKLLGMLGWPEGAVEGVSAARRREREQRNTGTSLKKAASPLLGAKLGQLAALPPKVQNALLEVKANIDILNEEIDMQRFYFEKTFSSATDTNHDIAIKSCAQCEVNVSERMRVLIEKISVLPKLSIQGIDIPQPSKRPPTAEEKAAAVGKD
jgi:hypothetical protein